MSNGVSLEDALANDAKWRFEIPQIYFNAESTKEFLGELAKV